MTSLSLMKHLCKVKHATKNNVDGEIIPLYLTQTTNVRCLLQENSGRYQLGEGGSSLSYSAILFVPPGTDIKPKGTDDARDQIVMTGPTHLNGRTFLVQHVADEAGRNDHLTVFLERVATGAG